MSAEFRTKLIHWLTSMMLLTLMSSLVALHNWFIWLPETNTVNWTLSDQIITLYSAIDLFQWIFIPIALWHFSDFVEAPNTKSAIARYRYIAGMIFALGIASIFHQSIWLNDLFCPEVQLPPNVLVFDGCGSWTPPWKTAIFLALYVALCGLAGIKALVTIRSRLRSRR